RPCPCVDHSLRCGRRTEEPRPPEPDAVSHPDRLPGWGPVHPRPPERDVARLVYVPGVPALAGRVARPSRTTARLPAPPGGGVRPRARLFVPGAPGMGRLAAPPPGGHLHGDRRDRS